MSNEQLEEVSLFGDNPDEIESAVTKASGEEETVVEDSSFKVPEKFQGKSFEDVVEAYTNLEQDHGRKANEVGELRKLTDEILRQQVTQPQQQQQQEDVYYNEDVGLDDFFDDPSAAVDKAVNNNPRLRAIEDAIQREAHDKSYAALKTKHADVEEVVNSPEFSQWVNQSPARQRMFQEAHSGYDAGLASELLDFYKSSHKMSIDDAREYRDNTASEGLKAATVERGSSNSSVKKVFRRADLIRLKIEQPTRYSAMEGEIQRAYAEGRVK